MTVHRCLCSAAILSSGSSARVPEISQKGLVHASRIVDADAQATQRRKEKAHRHAVVIVGIDQRSVLQAPGRRYAQVIAAFFGRGAKLAQFFGHRRQAVGVRP